MEMFRECLTDCGLTNLGFVGQRFTWCNIRIGEQVLWLGWVGLWLMRSG